MLSGQEVAVGTDLLARRGGSPGKRGADVVTATRSGSACEGLSDRRGVLSTSMNSAPTARRGIGVSIVRTATAYRCRCRPVQHILARSDLEHLPAQALGKHGGDVCVYPARTASRPLRRGARDDARVGYAIPRSLRAAQPALLRHAAVRHDAARVKTIRRRRNRALTSLRR